MIAATLRYVTVAVVTLAAAVMPRELQRWGHAMRCEVRSADSSFAMLAFAFGCLGTAVRLSILSPSIHRSTQTMPKLYDLADRPRAVGVLSGVAAVILGLAYMFAAGAPNSYLAMNAAALAAGLLAMGIIAQLARIARPSPSVVIVVLAATLLLVSVIGTEAGGATRWIRLGDLVVQPSLILVPILAVVFARSPDLVSAAGVAIAALALAIQPDRAMSGALMMAMTTLAVLRRDRAVIGALSAAIAGFVATLLQPDVQPAMPWVDQILFTAFDVHLLAGAAVLAGSALLILPAAVCIRHGRPYASTAAVFGTIWLISVIAAALGNYPTPLVGYGGSAILGYMVALTGMPRRIERRAMDVDATGEHPTRRRDGMMPRMISG